MDLSAKSTRPPATRRRASGAARTTAPPTRSSAYIRHRDLPKLIPLMDIDLPSDETVEAGNARHNRLLMLLRMALRAERRRGLGGDWSYDLGRHAALIEAYRHEVALAGAHATYRVPLTR